MSASLAKQPLFIALAIASLALVQGVGFFGEREATDALRWRKHTQQALLAISEVNERKDHTESLVREFVLTGTEVLASRAEKNFAEIHQRLAHARQLVGDEPNQAGRLDRLDATLKGLTDRWTTTLATRRAQGMEAARRLVADGTGQRVTDEAELLLEEMAAEEHRLLGERNARAERFSAVSSVAMKFCGGLTLLFGFLAWRALRAATAAVRASEESLAVTLQAIGDGVLATDAEGRITRLNPVGERLTGWTQAEAAGRPAAEVFHIVNETTRQPAFLPVADTLAKGTIHGLANHTILIARDGTERPIADSCAPIRSRAGEVIGAVLIFRDVTAAQAAERALAKSAHEIQDLYNHAPCGYHSVNAEGVFVAVNDTELKWFGRTREELIGKMRHRDLVTPDTQAAYDAGFAYFLEYGEVRDLEFTIARPDGSAMDVLLNATAVRDANGRLLHSRSTMFDITERKRTEARLAAALRADQLIMEHSLDVICTIDGQGRFDFVSAACVKLWGYQPEELAGRPYLDLVHPEDHPATNQAAAAIMAGRPVLNFENRYRRKDGTLVPVMWSASWSAADQLMFCVAHDVTERNQVEAVLQRAHEELSRANAELGRASRHKDEFLANMSHELRTPLNAILGLSEALLEQVSGTLTPRQVKSITTISTSGQHLLALINDILDLSKIEAGKLELHPEPLNVDEFCQSCLAFVRPQAMHKQIHVDHQRDPQPLVITADPRRLKQVLVNLLTNAVKFTPVSGRIGLSVAVLEGEDVMRFTVWDTGIGIAPADQTKLFQAFTQIDSGLSRAQEGTGLGLALVAKLVELHGGSVMLKSEVGKGSSFIVTLPLAQAPVAIPEGRTGDTQFIPRRVARGTIPATQPQIGAPAIHRALVIEDDPTAGEQFVHYLTLLGLQSVLHVRGAESIEAALREKPDVILLDILLPDESGWVVLARLKEHPATRDIPVVVVSVVDEPEKSLSMGAAAHFTKRFTRAQLTAFLNRPLTPKPAPAPRRAPKTPSAGPLILLAEDNEANIQTVGGYLADKGYDMHYALNGIVAVKLARDLRPALILMDIQMPMMDGLTAIRELRADVAFKNVPIIALTALAMSGDRERCTAAGATEYMSKPVKLEELAALVEGLLKRDA